MNKPSRIISEAMLHIIPENISFEKEPTCVNVLFHCMYVSLNDAFYNHIIETVKYPYTTKWNITYAAWNSFYMHEYWKDIENINIDYAKIQTDQSYRSEIILYMNKINAHYLFSFDMIPTNQFLNTPISLFFHHLDNKRPVDIIIYKGKVSAIENIFDIKYIENYPTFSIPGTILKPFYPDTKLPAIINLMEIPSDMLTFYYHTCLFIKLVFEQPFPVRVNTKYSDKLFPSDQEFISVFKPYWSQYKTNFLHHFFKRNAFLPEE